MAPSTGVRFISLVSLAVLVVLVKDTDAFIFRLMQRLRGIDLNHTKIPENTEASMTSPQIILNRGYPVEIHEVTTDDGYILELHRIPFSNRNNNQGYPAKKKVFLIWPGLMASSSMYLIGPTEKTLPYIMADRGYDVWIAATRGSKYARTHTRFHSNSEEFWDFSWDEVGEYDVPATIEYVLRQTGQEQLVFYGHSFGATVFFIAMIKHPELNAKVERMFAMGPTTSRHHSKNVLRHILPIVPSLMNMINRRSHGAFMRYGMIPRWFMRWRCENEIWQAEICRDMYFLGPSGSNPENFDLTLLPVFIQHYPLGTSTKTLLQFTQHKKIGFETFQAYDYGEEENLERYGSSKPPTYDLSAVTVPVYIFYSTGDLITTPEDTLWLEQQLPNVKMSYLIADPKFNHFDYVLGKNVNEMVNIPILTNMPPAID